MKINFISYSFLILTGFTLASCGRDDDQPASTTPTTQPAVANTEAAKNEAAARAAAATNADQTRAEFQKRLDAQVAELQNTINEMQKAEAADADAKSREIMAARRAEIAAQYQESLKRYNEFKAASDAEWQAKRDAVVASIEASNAKLRDLQARQQAEYELQQKLAEIDAKVREAEAQAQQTPNDQKVQQALADIRARRDTAQSKFAQWREAAADKYQSMKSAVMEDLESASQSLANFFGRHK